MNTIAAAIIVILPQLDLGGTQINELSVEFADPGGCAGCHGEYAEYAAYDTWAGSMMANAARDPLYLAALTVANQDIADSGELCIKCHSPSSWLFGRATPTDQSSLNDNDYEGVQCEFCHRMTPAPDGQRYIGNGDFYVANDRTLRGTLADPVATHKAEQSQYHLESEFCGVCHDVSNPLQNDFAIERTYTEWKNSAFADENKSCQSCHMARVEGGYNSDFNNPPARPVGVHDLVGGNTFIPRVLASMYPELDRAANFQYNIDKAYEMLESSSELTISMDAPDPGTIEGVDTVSVGKTNRMTVRVENLTGHKLPTGYPEGRRSWLQVELFDSAGNLLFQSGFYDAATATRLDDEQIRTYEVRLSSDGEEGFHFVKTDEVLQDNRIPPRGFRPTPETQPVGREYPVQEDGSLAYWDEAPYLIAVPNDAPLGVGQIRVTHWYQTTSREYIEFLRDENTTDQRGEQMYSLWFENGQGAPVAMTVAEIDVEFVEPPPTLCGCQLDDRRQSLAPTAWPALLGILALLWLRRRRSMTGR